MIVPGIKNRMLIEFASALIEWASRLPVFGQFSDMVRRAAAGFSPRISLTSDSGRLAGQWGWSDRARVVRYSPRAGPRTRKVFIGRVRFLK